MFPSSYLHSSPGADTFLINSLPRPRLGGPDTNHLDRAPESPGRAFAPMFDREEPMKRHLRSVFGVLALAAVGLFA